MAARGRPKGSGIDDSRLLAAVRLMMDRVPTLTRSTAIRHVLNNEAVPVERRDTIRHRLNRKLRDT